MNENTDLSELPTEDPNQQPVNTTPTPSGTGASNGTPSTTTKPSGLSAISEALRQVGRQIGNPAGGQAGGTDSRSVGVLTYNMTTDQIAYKAPETIETKYMVLGLIGITIIVLLLQSQSE